MTLSGHAILVRDGYRLPTEAQWEYAARAGLWGGRFPWGDLITHSQANYKSYWEGGIPYYSYDVNLTEGNHPIWDDGIYPYSSPVGIFAASGYGLHDMAGNVWEWCHDWYDNYTSDPQLDPVGPETGRNMRVLRGGSWDDMAKGCRVTYRICGTPNFRDYRMGFRVILNH